MAELYTTSLFSDANLVNYHRLEGDSNDAKGSNNGTDSAITYGAGTGKFGQAASFNGSSSKIVLGTPLSNCSSGNFTINMWIKTGTSTYSCLFSQSDTGNPAFNINIDNTRVLVQTYDGTFDTVTNTIAITDNNWHMVTIGRTSTTGYIYVDGGNEVSGALKNVTLGTPLSTIGVFKDNDGGGRELQWYTGAIDDFSYFTRLLTSTEIATLYTDTLSSSFFAFL